jgi:uncharacterized protein YbjT (DUF2867 family)
MSIRILVTGATGSVGRDLLRILSDTDATLVGGTTTLSKAAGLEEQGVEPALIDFSERASLAAAMRGVDSVFLLMPLAKSLGQWGSNALGVARAAGVHHVVRLSVMGADVNVAFRLGRAHGMVDQLVIESGIPYTILRPNAFMQNYTRDHGASIRERGMIELPHGDARTSLVDARDVARSAARVLMDPGPHWNRGYDLTGPEALSNHDVARAISAVTGREIRYRSVLDDDSRRAMLEAGLCEWTVEAVLSHHAHIRSGRAAIVSPDVEAITGSKPTTFEAFARDFAGSW